MRRNLTHQPTPIATLGDSAKPAGIAALYKESYSGAGAVHGGGDELGEKARERGAQLREYARTCQAFVADIERAVHLLDTIAQQQEQVRLYDMMICAFCRGGDENSSWLLSIACYARVRTGPCRLGTLLFFCIAGDATRWVAVKCNEIIHVCPSALIAVENSGRCSQENGEVRVLCRRQKRTPCSCRVVAHTKRRSCKTRVRVLGFVEQLNFCRRLLPWSHRSSPMHCQAESRRTTGGGSINRALFYTSTSNTLRVASNALLSRTNALFKIHRVLVQHVCDPTPKP